MEFPNEFQHQCINLIKHIIPISGARFLIIDPHMDKIGFVGYNVETTMENQYKGTLEHLDPMHYSNFEESEETVISSNTVMKHQYWLKTMFYQDFIKPYGYTHVTDCFLRNNGRIVAILTVLRDEALPEFSPEELEKLRGALPFIEYSLNSIYIPARVSEREYVRSTYGLTNRELDVLELALTGIDNKTMTKHLEMSLPTLRTHLQHIFTKTQVNSSSELIAKILKELYKSP